MTNTAYDYSVTRSHTDTESYRDALWSSVLNYQYDQLNWERKDCRRYFQKLLEREVAVAVLSARGKAGWTIDDARLLDVGTGQAALVLEALTRGADAYGIEPGKEFAHVAATGVDEIGHDTSRIQRAVGEELPYSRESFDYVTCLQVLEHVREPGPILSEVYRVLKPGGKAFIAYVDYFGFWEPHYRVPWLPLLPKSLGTIYLRLLGKDPRFFDDYVYYRTAPEVRQAALDVGFRDITVQEYTLQLRRRTAPKGTIVGVALSHLDNLPRSILLGLVACAHGLRSVLNYNARIILQKPA